MHKLRNDDHTEEKLWTDLPFIKFSRKLKNKAKTKTETCVGLIKFEYLLIYKRMYIRF